VKNLIGRIIEAGKYSTYAIPRQD